MTTRRSPDRRGGGRARAVCLALIAVLFAASVPWYRSAEAPLRLWWGLPDWVAVALACYLGAAFANVLAWRLTDIDDADTEESGTGDPGPS